MKKFIFTSVMMCLGVVFAKAEPTDVSSIDNVVYLNPVTASAGTQYVLSIQMKNVTAIAAYEFYLSLPDGITYAEDEDNILLAALSEARTTSKKTTFFESTVTEDGLLHVLCSTTKEDPNTGNLYTFSGTDGEVCTVPVNIPADMEPGSYPVVLTEIVVTEPDTKNYYETARVETTMTIEANDGRLHFDENSSTLPTYTSGSKADVAINRTIKAGQWNTIVLPFTLTKTKAETIFGSDVQLAEFTGFVVDYGEDEDNVVPLSIEINLTPYTMSNKKSMVGGKPYVIKTSKDIASFEADDVTMVGSVTDVTKNDEYETPGKFTGSFVKTKVPTDGLFVSNNKFWYSTGNTNIKAFRCWFELGAVLDAETDFGARAYFHFEEATGILDVQRNTCNEDYYYDLQGRRVKSSIFHSQSSITKSGVYVKDGKKVVIK